MLIDAPKPGIYSNIHYPNLLVRVTKGGYQNDGRGRNINMSGHIEPLLWGVHSQHWEMASFSKTIYFYLWSLKFTRIIINTIVNYKFLYQWIFR